MKYSSVAWFFNPIFLVVFALAGFTWIQTHPGDSTSIVNSAMGETLGAQLARDIHSSVNTLKESVTLRDWLTSGFTPTDVLNNAQSLNNAEAGRALCQTLEGLSPADLAIFEDALNSEAARSFSCTGNLQSQIQDYWTQEKEKIQLTQRGTSDAVHVEARKLEAAATEITSDDLEDGEFSIVFEGNLDQARTGQILKVLQVSGARATFLIPGQNARAHASLVELLSSSGQITGSQGSQEEDMSLLPTSTADQALDDGNRALSSLTGNSLHLFSFPFMVGASGSEYDALQDYTRSKKMVLIQSDLDSEDWKTPDPIQLSRDFALLVSQSNKGVITLHGRLEQTVLALPTLLQSIASQNRKLVIFTK